MSRLALNIIWLTLPLPDGGQATTVAAITSRCAFRNAFHEVRFCRSCAGSMPCFFQNIFDCIGCNHVTKIGECALDSAVTPGSIIPRHAEYQIGDLLRDAWTRHSMNRLFLILFDNNIIQLIRIFAPYGHFSSTGLSGPVCCRVSVVDRKPGIR